MNIDNLSLEEAMKFFTKEEWEKCVKEWYKRNPDPDQWIIFRPTVLFGTYEMNIFINKLQTRSLKYRVDSSCFLSQKRTSVEIPSIHKVITIINIDDLNKIDEFFNVPTYNRIPFAILEKLLS